MNIGLKHIKKKGGIKVAALIIFFFFGAACGIAVDHGTVPGWLPDILTALTTLIAAYVGAHSAFRFNERREEKNQLNQQASYGNQAIFNLIKAYIRLKNFHEQFIEPHQQSPERAFAIPPALGQLGGFEAKSSDYLAFLLSSSSPNIVNEIAQLDSHIAITFELIADRSRMHREDIQVKLDQSGFVQDLETSREDLICRLGERLVVSLEMSTDMMIDNVNSLITECEELIPKVHSVLKRRFPGQNIITLKHPLGESV